MYVTNRGRRRYGPGPAEALGETVIAPDARTGAQCRAEERRIRTIIEPRPDEVVPVAPQYLADPSRPKLLHRGAYDAYRAMKAAAEADGLPRNVLTITSGYRSIAHQKLLWADALQKYGTPVAARRWVASPGGSPHHTGRAIDLHLGTRNRPENQAALRATPAFRWLVCNAARFGFTPYANEPWHWEYNPPGFDAQTPALLKVSAPSAPAVSPRLTTADLQVIQAGRARGVRDLSRLTDLVFHARHPERGGRALARGETALIAEWRAIRSALSAPAGGTRLAGFGEPRSLSPEDVSGEMIGRPFQLSAPFPVGTTPVAAGSTVEVVAWANGATVARVRTPALGPFDVPKVLLRPVAPVVGGIVPYSADVASVAADFQRGAQAVLSWLAQQARYRTAAAQRLFTEELARLQGLQRNREVLLNRRLIQETMFNRFDVLVRQWTDHYNRQFGRAGADALDPNLAKSLFYQESRMGTSGPHLEVPPSHPVRSRFNLGQVIDSSGAALLIMIAEMQPALLATHHLQNIQTDLADAQRELKRLTDARLLTATQRTRLAELRRLSARNWEVFLWGYRAPGRSTGFFEATRDFFAATTPARHLDYAFWIRTAIRWLFEKRRSESSWPEAVRAYNGSGPPAQRYRDEVLNRARDAIAAQRAGRAFVPQELRPAPPQPARAGARP